MNRTTLDQIRFRADCKLRYAEVHLDELRAERGDSDFERAHLESFLFHLLGARDAFLVELNEYYSGDLAEDEVTIGRLRNALAMNGVRSSEVAELYALEHDADSWLFDAKRMRNYLAHSDNVDQNIHISGPANRQPWLDIHSTRNKTEGHFVDELAEWVTNMRELLHRLRSSAISAMNRSFSANSM